MKSKPHPTDSFRPKDEYRTVVTSWVKGVVELHLLKFPPDGQRITSFRIVGRLDPEEPYVEHGKVSESFLDKYATFKSLIDKLDQTYTKDGFLISKPKK